MSKLQEILTLPLSREVFYERLKKIKELNAESIEKKIKYIRDNFLGACERMIENAEQYINGMHILPGTKGEWFFVGNPPAWFDNRGNDEEYVWTLNRMHHWKDLLNAYYVTKDSKYAEKVISELLNWIDQCPRPKIDLSPGKASKSFYAADPWRTLEVGIRMFDSWPLVLEYLLETDYFTPELLEKYIISVDDQGEVLEKICPIFWPEADHNHYLQENLGLLSIACNFPELKKSQYWAAYAMNELERCLDAQITDDGGQIEGCPGYHNACIYFFCKSIILARKNGLSFSYKFVEKLNKCLDYTLYSFRPSGTGVPLGDSDADKTAVKSALFGYLALGEIKWLKMLTDIMGFETIKIELSKYIWEIPVTTMLLEGLKDNRSTASLPVFNWQHELNQVAIRTDWSKDALSIFFSCRTPILNAHAHIDLNYKYDITAESAAKICNMSYSYFSRFFKTVMKKTFNEYLNFIRIVEAEKLLLTTNLNITEIAHETGFSTSSYFIQQFKRHKKISPKQFKKSFDSF